MISRYTRPEMGRIWTDRNRLQIWFEIELLALEAMAEEGLVPGEVAPHLREKQWQLTDADVQEVARLEEETHHDVIAFLTLLERRLGPEARFMHLGMTSSDVLDTALAVQLTQACNLLLSDLDELREVVKVLALRHQDTVMVGRTHGIHAEPTTFGLVLLVWFEELSRQRDRLTAARSSVAVGKCSGAVGTFAHLPLSVEEKVCARLGLRYAPVSNQVVQRDRHAELFCALANLGSTLEKMAVNLRHLQRTEVSETAEPFAPGQRGSSAMPHKKNPIGFENVTGLARLLRSHAIASLENVALWHERDISHSSVERVIAPDATILADYAMVRMSRLLKGIRVDEAQMSKNLESTHGLIYSQEVLLALVRSGMEREQAYALVQEQALKSWDTKKPLLELLLADQRVMSSVTPEQIKKCFDPAICLSRVSEIFRRVVH